MDTDKNKKFSEMTDSQIWVDLAYATLKDALPLQNRKHIHEPLKDCCRVINLLREIGLRHMWVYHGDRRFEAAKLNYCPECGRKL